MTFALFTGNLNQTQNATSTSVLVTTQRVARKKAVSKSKRSGLIFPVARILKMLKTSKLARASRISACSAVYLSAVLEYLTSNFVIAFFIIDTCL